MKYDRPEDIPDEVLAKTKTLKTYMAMARRRARDRGIAYEDLTDGDWRKIYWDKSKRRHDYYRRTEIPERVGVDLQEADGEQEVSVDGDRLRAYTEYYQDPAPNDLLTIQQLISMQTQLELIDKQIAIVIDSEEINVSRWRDLTRIQKELSTETRMLQDTLGISRKAREARKQEEELSDRLSAHIDQARQLIDERGVKLICPHCEGMDGKRINQGFAIHHFPEMGLQIVTRCPACQRTYEIRVEPKKWERKIEPPI